MTTATAPEIEKANTVVDGIERAVGVAGDVAMRFQSPVLAAMFGPVAGIGFDKAVAVARPTLKAAYNSVADTTTKLLNEASNIAVRDHISKMEPNAVLDFAAEQSPELKEIAEVGKTDPAFAQAFKDMLVKDKEALPQIKEMLKEDSSGVAVEYLKGAVKNPETRGQLTLKMQEVAERDDYDFKDMQKELLESAQANSWKEFFHDILANPNKFLEKMENWLGKDNMFVAVLRPVLALSHGVASLMREGLGQYAELGPKLSDASEDYLAKQGNTWSTFTPG